MQNKTNKHHRFAQGQKIVRLLFHLITLLALCLPVYISPGNTNELDKVMFKALYTYKFGKFTEWPDKKLNPNTPRFLYCILGRNRFSQKMKAIFNGKLVQDIPVKIEVFDSSLVAEKVLSSCHVLFINKSEKRRLSTIFNSLNHASILTISDIHKFSSRGGMITLIEDQGKLRFQINPDAIQQATLSISSKIMELAEIVNEGKR
jgi:hypothetical protein